MSGRTRVLAVGLGVVALTATAALIPAQPPAEKKLEDPTRKSAVSFSVQDALTRPFDFPFGKATKIEEVAAELSKAIKAPVVLDRAAMGRLDVRPDDTVQLELHGVRLKTGLRLLLDQLDMTYRVEPEDNLLILTDTTGANDPMSRVLSEIEALHHDVHNLQESVDAVRTAMGLSGTEGEKLRKPTIIEEVPSGGEAKPKTKAPTETPAPRSRPGA
jgi:hypothetical protein